MPAICPREGPWPLCAPWTLLTWGCIPGGEQRAEQEQRVRKVPSWPEKTVWPPLPSASPGHSLTQACGVHRGCSLSCRVVCLTVEASFSEGESAGDGAGGTLSLGCCQHGGQGQIVWSAYFPPPLHPQNSRGVEWL